jgi:hypothetical protein
VEIAVQQRMPENILILADWRIAGLVDDPVAPPDPNGDPVPPRDPNGDPVPPRDPNGDDDEEEEDEGEDEDEESNNQPVVREPKPDE